MTAMDIVLLIVAAVLIVFACVVLGYQFRHRAVALGPLAAGFAGGFVSWVALHHWLPQLIAHHVRSGYQWLGTFLTVAVAVTVGAVVWGLDRDLHDPRR